jgi:signal transduction histidine kinase
MDGPWILLTVSNEGPGIPSELSSQFLRPFTAGATSTGLGLGLYLAKRIAEAHYGTLTVDSPGREGVQVTLGLPVEDEDFDEFNHYEGSGPGG